MYKGRDLVCEMDVEYRLDRSGRNDGRCSGILSVFPRGGYPVTGVTIGMAGICLVAVSLTGSPFTFLIGQEIKKRKKKQKTADVSAPEEEENHA